MKDCCLLIIYIIELSIWCQDLMVNNQSDDIVQLGTEGGTLDNAAVVSGRSNVEEFLESKLFESI